MGRKKISRRDALGVIGKAAALGTGTYFFLSLKTSPLAGASLDAPVLEKAPPVAEKVVISGSGLTLMVKISGRPGRHCAVSYATTDAADSYKAVPSSRGVIGKDGLCTIAVDVKSLPSAKVYLRVVTGKTSAFDDDIAGTEAFIVHVSKGAIARYEGLQSRPLENQMAVASCAAAAMEPVR